MAGEYKAKPVIFFCDGRGSEARAADRCQHFGCAKVGELGRASVSTPRICHR